MAFTERLDYLRNWWSQHGDTDHFSDADEWINSMSNVELIEHLDWSKPEDTGPAPTNGAVPLTESLMLSETAVVIRSHAVGEFNLHVTLNKLFWDVDNEIDDVEIFEAKGEDAAVEAISWAKAHGYTLVTLEDD